ncbi:MAG: ThiF family adenylyltransferase, partial [Bacteroidota bacterium]
MKTTSKKHILLIGAGGLCHAALPSILDLPFEKMTLMDGDVVTEEPLSRQWLFTKNDLNQFKVVVLQKWISDRDS